MFVYRRRADDIDMRGFDLEDTPYLKGIVVAIGGVLLVTALSFAAAFGHDTLSDEKYIRKVETLLTGDEASADRRARLMNAIWSPDPTVSLVERVGMSEEYFKLVETQLEVSVAEISDLQLTPRMTRINGGILFGLQHAATTTEEVVEFFPEVHGEALLETLFFIYAQGFEPLSAACNELQIIAEERDISAQLVCEPVLHPEVFRAS